MNRNTQQVRIALICALNSDQCLKATPGQRGLLIRVVRLIEDLRRYLELCLARFLLWRETRRRRAKE